MKTTSEGAPVVRPVVLIVDDERIIQRTLGRTLRGHGFEVELASSAEEGRERLAQRAIQVVVSDLRMGGEDGITFLAGLRESHPKVQRILISGRFDVNDIQRAINIAGVHRFIPKPWEVKGLVETVQESAARWSMEAERDGLLRITTAQKESLQSLNEQLEEKVADRTAMLERVSTYWRNTFDSIQDPVIVVNDTLVVQRANLAAADMAGDEIRTFLGRRCHQALFGRDMQCVGCPLSHTAGGKGDGHTAEMEESSGGRLWRVNAWGFQANGLDGGESERWTVCHYQDMTQEKALQRQVFTLDKLAAVGELAGCVAHELNNPLTGILTFSQIMKRGLSSEMAADLAVDIEDAARRCSNIVRSLLDFSRPSGSMAVMTDVDVGELLVECVNLAKLHVNQRSEALKITCECAPGMAVLYGNVDAYKSLFINLINNAIQAMNKVGEVSVNATFIEAGHQVRVTIDDTGPGVPEDLRQSVFKPFFTTKAENKGGTGLGLAIVGNVVNDHGGRVWIEDAPSGGARFVVELPLKVEVGAQDGV